LPEEENRIAEVEQDDTSRSDASSSGLPRPLITAEDYEALVCRSCVSQIPILQAWAGTPGVAMVVREAPDDSWKIIGALAEENPVEVDGLEAASNAPPAPVEQPDLEMHTTTEPVSEDTCPPLSHAEGRKRSLLSSSPSADGPSVKRSRTSGMSCEKACLVPTRHPLAQSVFVQDGARTLGEGDIFLSGDWRKRWCLCDSCLPELRKHLYLLEEEETYEPPKDPDSRELQSSMLVRVANNPPLQSYR
jgi:E3 ubiquitin-protein ligase UBR7